MTSLVNEHLWEFPHTMTLKVLGATGSPLEAVVTAVITEQIPAFDPNKHMHVVPSSKGNFISVNARFTVDNADQVRAIYAALNASPHVKVVF